MVSSFISHSPSRDDRVAFALCIQVVEKDVELRVGDCRNDNGWFTLCKKKSNRASHAAAIAATHYCSKEQRAHHVSAIAAIIAVSSHIIAQNDRSTKSTSRVGNCRNNSGRFPHYCSIREKNLVL